MKNIKTIIAIGLILCTVFASTLPCFAKVTDVEVTAHRGYSAAAPENTLAAVYEASKFNFTSCEFDIRPTKDDVWVVSHLNTLISYTDSARLISMTDYDKLKDIKITKGNHVEKYPNETIPTLIEMLDECARYGMKPVIDIKDGNSDAIDELCDILDARPEKNNITVISFNILYLKAIKDRLPYIKCLYISEAISDIDIQLCLNNGIDGITFNCNLYSKEIIARAQSNGLFLSAWSISDIETAKELYALSVKSFTTSNLTPSIFDTISESSTQSKTKIGGKIVTILKVLFRK